MNRRKFLKASSLWAAMPTGHFDFGQVVPEKAVTDGAAEFSLKQLKDQYHRDLFDDFLPFMDKYVIDHEYGGFMCNTDADGRNITQNKNLWFEGRGIWVYSFLYNHLAREPKYLEVARKSVEFILKAKPPAKSTLWPRDFTREGKPLSGPEIEIYGDLFVAEGLSEYSQAANEPGYWDMAKEIVLNCVSIYDQPDYNPNIGETYLGPGARPFPGARIQGVWMVLVRTATQMLEKRDDAEIRDVAQRCVDAVVNHHFNPEFRLNNELMNRDLSRPTNEYAELVYTGHSIETLWMVLEEAVRLRDRALFDLVALRFKRHVEVAWDDVYDGVFRNLQNVDQNMWSLDKALWAQEEVLVGSLFILEHTGAQWAKDMFTKTFVYVHAKFSLKRFGYPIWIPAADRKVTFEKHITRVENYHHPRHLMLNLLRLNRMIRAHLINGTRMTRGFLRSSAASVKRSLV